MEYKIKDIDEIFQGKIVENLGDNQYVIKINDIQHDLKILQLNSKGIEFILDQQYHVVKYLKTLTSEMDVIVDGTLINLKLNSNLDEIVYKNSGGASDENSEVSLYSQIPGKVISVAVNVGDIVKKGDTICVLESMKMQVAVKSHKDGTVKIIKIKKGDTVAKNDLIAEIE